MCIFVGIQQALSQICDENLVTKERGFLVMKLIKAYFRENEKKWIEILKRAKK